MVARVDGIGPFPTRPILSDPVPSIGGSGRGDKALTSGARDGSPDSELHDIVGLGVVLVPGKVTGVTHGKGLARIGGEIDNDLVALGDRQDQCVGRDRALDVAAIGGDDDHRDLGAVAAADIELVGAADAGVQEAEAVLARLHGEERPGDAVDVDHVAVVAWRKKERSAMFSCGICGKIVEHTVFLSLGSDQLCIAVVDLVGDHKRNIVFPLGEIQCGLLHRIREDVDTSLSPEGIHSGDVNGMVVVPERARTLVGVVVVFVLVGKDEVLRPTIPDRPGGRSMETGSTEAAALEPLVASRTRRRGRTYWIDAGFATWLMKRTTERRPTVVRKRGPGNWPLYP